MHCLKDFLWSYGPEKGNHLCRFTFNILYVSHLSSAASIDEDFEKWCSEFHEALEKRSDLVGAKADQKADESINGVAAYDVQVR